jgi:CBS domain-containing protein
MLVRDILESQQREIVTAKPETSVLEAMNLLINNKISCLPVVDREDKLVGILSDKDIFRLAHSDQNNFTKAAVSDIMTRRLIVALAEDDLDYIAGIMTENRIRHIPIVEKDKMIGLVSQGDVVKKQMKDIQVQNRYLKMYIDGGPTG